MFFFVFLFFFKVLQQLTFRSVSRQMSVVENYQHRQLSACHLLSQYAGTWFCLDNGRQAAASERTHTHTYTGMQSLAANAFRPFYLEKSLHKTKTNRWMWPAYQSRQRSRKSMRRRTFGEDVTHMCDRSGGGGCGPRPSATSCALTQISSDKRSQLPLTHSPRHLQPHNQQVAFLISLFFCLCLFVFPSPPPPHPGTSLPPFLSPSISGFAWTWVSQGFWVTCFSVCMHVNNMSRTLHPALPGFCASIHGCALSSTSLSLHSGSDRQTGVRGQEIYCRSLPPLLNINQISPIGNLILAFNGAKIPQKHISKLPQFLLNKHHTCLCS